MGSGGGGKDTYYWYTKGLGASVLNNPSYTKMAADSIAQEVEERKLVVPTPPAAEGATDDAEPTAGD
jgi:hypothetical protein